MLRHLLLVEQLNKMEEKEPCSMRFFPVILLLLTLLLMLMRLHTLEVHHPLLQLLPLVVRFILAEEVFS